MPAGTDGGRPPRRPRRLARPLLWILCVGSSCASLIALAGEWHWFAELFTHFRLYYLLAQGLLIIVFLNTRRYAWLVATVMLAVPNAWYVGPYIAPLLVGARMDADARPGPQILTLNLSATNLETRPAIDYIRRQQPDLVVLSEYTPAWHAAMHDELNDWPYRIVRPREGFFGMAVYSRDAFRRAEQLDFGVPGSENLRVELAKQDITLYAVHFVPPVSPQFAAERDRQLAALARELAGARRPRLVTGDLNLTPFSPYFPRLLAASGLHDARRAQGLHVTWPAMPLPLWIPIDHVLADPEAGVIDVRTGPDIGSDHWPLEITLAPAG